MRHIFSAAAIMTMANFSAPAALAFDGCLGAKVTACLDAIKPHIGEIDYQLALRSIDKYLAGDIAGKRKAKGVVIVSYHSKFAEKFESPQTLAIDYSPALEIAQIEITLRKGAGGAESEAEYQATHMYETTIFALGSHENCRELATAHDFYLFFHKDVKTRLKQLKIEHAKGEFKPASELAAETGWIGICGKKMNYVVSGAEWGSAQADMERKFSAYSGSLVFR